MKRKAVVEIDTDASGEFCMVTCPHFAGACDAYGKPLKRVPKTFSAWYRCDECKKAEVKGGK